MVVDPITAGLDLAGTIAGIVNKFVPDADQAAKDALAIAITTAANSAARDAAQSSLDASDAATPGLWRGGWRPAVGWISAAAFAWSYALQPILAWFLALFGVVALPPTLDASTMLPVLLGLLGLGGLRSFEKTRGLP